MKHKADLEYCDDCGEPLGRKSFSFASLPFDVASANKGESGVLCSACANQKEKQDVS